MRECVTHHLACECREAIYADVVSEGRKLRAERDHYRDWITAMLADGGLWRDQGEDRLRTNVRMTLAGSLEPYRGA